MVGRGERRPWATFTAYEDGHQKFTDAWLLDPVNFTSSFRDGTQYCRLCDSLFVGLPAVHVAGHEPDLRAWRERQGRNGKPTDVELEAKLAEALDLVERGVSQRKAASMSGFPRTSLQRALESRDEGARDAAHARTGVPWPASRMGHP
jgi:predicted DNA-binding protein (UPF0251 family)